MRLVFAGTPTVALPSLEALLASHHEVVGVVSRPDADAGRGRRSTQSPVTLRALAAGLPVLQPARPGDPVFLEALTQLAPHCCPVVAYGALVPPLALAVPSHGWVNLHFSLLPAWRGAAPVQRAVMAGDDVTGATTFVLTQGLDTGPVLGTMTTAIGPRDTAGDVLGRLAVDGANLLVASLDGLEAGQITPTPQSSDGVSAAPKVSVEDARVRWSEPAFAVDRRVRGCTPAPGGWTTWRGQRLKLGPVVPARRIEGDQGQLLPGQLATRAGEVLVGTATDPVRLSQVQPAGRRSMPAGDWARGARLDVSERLGDAA